MRSLLELSLLNKLNRHYKILSDKPLSVVTVFNKSCKLPKDDDKDRLNALSRLLFIVGDHAIKKDRAFEKKAKQHLPNVKITSVPTKIGLSRFRRTIDKNEWHVETFGSVITCHGMTGLDRANEQNERR
jgi:GTP-binding protein EngB required for normal cell division